MSVLLLVTVFTGLAGAVVATSILLAVAVVIFAWGAIAGVRRHPFGVLFRRVVRPHLAAPVELEDPAAPRFAQLVGLIVTGVGLLLALIGLPLAAPIAAGLAFIAAFLNAAFGFCIGCQMYLALVRAGLVRRGAARAA